MDNTLIQNIIPIVIPIIFIGIGFFLIKVKGFNQTKVFLTIGPLIGLVLGLLISFSFKVGFVNGFIITVVFRIFGLIVLSIVNLIIKQAMKREAERKKLSYGLVFD
ncbi:hypothetical protein [Alkalihalobacillus deserti]|uniref:hypothetical protein n=1 Tax=Alkalihalobacillus deserti TaxID=2879466 RepID=UPI001D158E72|nr:hypothetical protein [Alkalihalobacillus deserti]